MQCVQAKSKARIRFANLMILQTIIGACLTIYYAKNNSRQNSLVEENERRHLQYRRGELGGGARLGLITNARPAETGSKE